MKKLAFLFVLLPLYATAAPKALIAPRLIQPAIAPLWHPLAFSKPLFQVVCSTGASTCVGQGGGGGGGGGTPGGANTQVQFNDGGAFGGNQYFVFDKTNTIITFGQVGGSNNVIQGPSSASGSSSNILLRGGANTGGAVAAGFAQLLGGNSTVNGGTGGAASVIGGSGAANNASGGDAVIQGGPKNGSGTAGSILFQDSTDNSKILQHVLSGLTTATTRSVTWPDSTGDVAVLSATGLVARTGAATWAARTITAGTGITMVNGDGVSGNPTPSVDTAIIQQIPIVDTSLIIGTNGGQISQQSAGTPDQSGFWTGTTSNAWIIAENADKTFDFAHAAATDPTLFIHSNAQATDKWVSLRYSQSNGVAIIGTGSGGLMFTLDGGSSTLAGVGNDGSFRSQSTSNIGFVSGADASAGNDAFWTRQAAAIFQQGADAGTAVNQTLKGPDSTTSAVTGGKYTIAAGDGTVGNANGGDLVLSGGAKAGTGVQGPVDLNASWLKNQQGEVALNADYTNATASFTSTALSVTVVSGQTYRVQAVIFLANTIAADGAQLDFNGGSATATNFRMHCVLDDTTTTIQDSAQISALATAFAKATLSGTGQHEWACNGTFVPSASGTFIVRGSKNSNTTGTLTFNRGSWLSVKNARPL